MKSLAPIWPAAMLATALACTEPPGEEPANRPRSPTVVSLISGESRGMLSHRALGLEVAVLDGPVDWQPMGPEGSWHSDQGTLVVESAGKAFELERVLHLDAAQLHSLEVTLASSYKVRLALSWTSRTGAESDGEPALVLDYNQGRGDPERKTFTFDLRSHSRWSGMIDRLRLRLEPARKDERIVVRRLRGLRQTLPPDVLAEQSRQPWNVELDREVRRSLIVPPGQPQERDVVVPEAGVLEFGLGATGRLSAPITFRISARRADGASRVLFASSLEPLDRAGARRWRSASVDLGALSGERIRLRAESLAGEGFDPTLGLPAWANPEIVSSAETPSRPNIILISIDTLRADHLSLYGYPHPTSPRIDAWARRFAVVFRHAVVQAPWTLPSHASMLTGVDALRHGVNHPFVAAPEELTTLAERLSEEGYFTAGLTGGGWLNPRYGLAGGYERYRYWIGERRGDEELEAHGAIASRWLSELRQPFFLFLHTFDVHDFDIPSRVELPLAEQPLEYRVLHYDRAVTHMDGVAGRFLESFEANGLRGRTILALTSDHGEDLGEGDVYGHGSLREQVLLVPLILELPDGSGAGTTVDQQVRSVDLVPTLLDLAGVESPPGLDGVSLRALTEGRSLNAPRIATSYFSPAHGLSLRYGNRWKYLYDSSVWQSADQREALYRLPGESRQELEDPAGRRAESLRSLARRLLDERLIGLRLRFENTMATPFAGILRGDLIRLGVPKSTDLADPWVRVAGDVAELSVAPGEGFHVLFERVGDGRFELESAGERLALDLESLALPVTFRWTASGWQQSEPAAGAAGVVTLEWRGTSGGEDPPFEQDPELRQQLEALGYLE